MNFNSHKEYEGKHAFLGASQFRWMAWDYETTAIRYINSFSQELGTSIHELAQHCINSRTKLSKSDKHVVDLFLYTKFIPKIAYDSEKILMNLAPFVNDAIGFHMASEVVLFYSKFCFGTTDAIGFDERKKELRIHDLKTGETPAHIDQLMIYAALFYLEYNIKPKDCTTILRIYQNSEIQECVPDPMDIEKIMELIVDRSNYMQMSMR